MTREDYPTFRDVVLGFAELKGKQLSAPAIELYWRVMQHWMLEDFRRAAEHLLRTCEFMPVPKDFEDLRKAGRATAGEAWSSARMTSGRCFWGGRVSDSGVTSGSALTDRAVRAIGGYSVIAMCDVEKLHFLERRFCEHYEAMSGADEVRVAVPEIAAYVSHERLAGPQPIAKLLERSQS